MRTARSGAAQEDIAVLGWDGRGLQTAVSKGGNRIYGQDLEEGKVYELSDRELWATALSIQMETEGTRST